MEGQGVPRWPGCLYILFEPLVLELGTFDQTADLHSHMMSFPPRSFWFLNRSNHTHLRLILPVYKD